MRWIISTALVIALLVLAPAHTTASDFKMRVALCSKAAVSGAVEAMMFSKFVVMTVSPSSENQALSTATSKYQ
eukprot:6470801-Amphidinium_carterae.1